LTLHAANGFLDPDAQTLYFDWEAVARLAVAGFRADVARAGAMVEVAAMVDELSRSSPAFKTMWQDNDVSDSSHAVKDLRHPVLGRISFEASTFGVDGRQDLTRMVFLSTDTKFAGRITRLLGK
jgi:MmyB-like transcription regulator ligand binding domain